MSIGTDRLQTSKQKNGVLGNRKPRLIVLVVFISTPGRSAIAISQSSKAPPHRLLRSGQYIISLAANPAFLMYNNFDRTFVADQ